jgi:hypothetical protein
MILSKKNGTWYLLDAKRISEKIIIYLLLKYNIA